MRTEKLIKKLHTEQAPQTKPKINLKAKTGKETNMRMSDTDKLQAEYVETYNKYMTMPDDSKELKTLHKKLMELEQTLTRRFLLESGYTLEKVNNNEFATFTKEDH